MDRLMSVRRPRKRPPFELSSLLVRLLDCLLLIVIFLRASGRMWGLYLRQRSGLRNLYTHSFSIIDALSFLRLRIGY